MCRSNKEKGNQVNSDEAVRLFNIAGSAKAIKDLCVREKGGRKSAECSTETLGNILLVLENSRPARWMTLQRYGLW